MEDAQTKVPSPFFSEPYTGPYWTIERLIIEHPPIGAKLFASSGMTLAEVRALEVKAAEQITHLEGSAFTAHGQGDTIYAAVTYRTRLTLLEIKIAAHIAGLKWNELTRPPEATKRRY